MMTIADDYVAALAPWITPDLETYARAIAGMFAEVEQYAADPDETDAPDPVVIRANWFPDPSFEYDQLNAAPTGFTANAGGGTVTTFAVQGGWATIGAKSLRMTFATVPAGAITAANPPTSSYVPVTPGRLASARAVFNVQNVNTQPELWIDWFDSGLGFLGQAQVNGTAATGVQTLTITDAVAPAGAAFAMAFPVLHNGTGSAATLDAYVDAIMFMLDGPVTSTFANGDTPGWEWTGTPGSSPSQPVPPVPQVGWSIMLDPDLAPAKGLPYLAQWAGERLPQGLSEAASRAWIKRAPNRDRGELEAIVNGIFPFLTGTQAVYTKERVKIDGTVSADWLAIITFASETPYPSLVSASFRRTADASVNIDYQAATTATWSGLEGTYATWSALEAANSTWLAAEALTAGTIPPGFTRWTP